MLILYFLLIDQSVKNYLETIVSLSQSQQQLAIAMATGGALVVSAAGFPGTQEYDVLVGKLEKAVDAKK